jgi:hypothetical protein
LSTNQDRTIKIAETTIVASVVRNHVLAMFLSMTSFACVSFACLSLPPGAGIEIVGPRGGATNRSELAALPAKSRNKSLANFMHRPPLI